MGHEMCEVSASRTKAQNATFLQCAPSSLVFIGTCVRLYVRDKN